MGAGLLGGVGWAAGLCFACGVNWVTGKGIEPEARGERWVHAVGEIEIEDPSGPLGWAGLSLLAWEWRGCPTEEGRSRWNWSLNHLL